MWMFSGTDNVHKPSYFALVASNLWRTVDDLEKGVAVIKAIYSQANSSAG